MILIIIRIRIILFMNTYTSHYDPNNEVIISSISTSSSSSSSTSSSTLQQPPPQNVEHPSVVQSTSTSTTTTTISSLLSVSTHIRPRQLTTIQTSDQNDSPNNNNVDNNIDTNNNSNKKKRHQSNGNKNMNNNKYMNRDIQMRLNKKKRENNNNNMSKLLRFQKKRQQHSTKKNDHTKTTPAIRTCTSPETNAPWIFGNTCTIHDVQKYYNYHNTNLNNDNDNQHMNMKNHSSILVQSRTSDHICGYCNNPFPQNQNNENNDSTSKTTNFANCLHQLSEQLRILKQQECNQLIIYGVAFGEQYVQWLLQEPVVQDEEEEDDDEATTIRNTNQEHVKQLIQTHGRCFITFVLAENLNLTKTTTTSNTNTNTNHNLPTTKYFYSMDGLQLLIPIYISDLPYKNMRRNTKIFKTMGPSYIFHWSLRVIWQDAKLIGMDMNTNINTIQVKPKKKYSNKNKKIIQQSQPSTPPKKYILPNNYYHYYFQVIELSSIPHQNHVCASFMGLPFHKNTMSSLHIKKIHTVQFAPHCDAIYEAFSTSTNHIR
jgi:hypothetical protein